jgi:hypothetical protein
MRGYLARKPINEDEIVVKAPMEEAHEGREV